MRQKSKGVDNAYFLVFFATCREIRYMEKVNFDLMALDSDEEEEAAKVRGEKGRVLRQISNFIFVYGCAPGSGVIAETNFVKDVL